ncbi:unnamed protein product, partial [Coregonus sp. 'balchen']
GTLHGYQGQHPSYKDQHPVSRGDPSVHQQTPPLQMMSTPVAFTGYRCTLQQRPSSNRARVTPRSNASEAGGRVRPQSSSLGRMKNSLLLHPGEKEGTKVRAMELKSECPRVPCNAKHDNTHGQQQDTWRGEGLSQHHPHCIFICPLHRIENNSLQDTTKFIIRMLTTSKEFTMQNPTNNTPLQQDHTETIQIQEAPTLNKPQSTGALRGHHQKTSAVWISLTTQDKIIHCRTTGFVVPKQRALGHDMEQEQKCIPLQIMPAAVHKERAPTSVRQHVVRLPKIKTTKTYCMGPLWTPGD